MIKSLWWCLHDDPGQYNDSLEHFYLSIKESVKISFGLLHGKLAIE